MLLELEELNKASSNLTGDLNDMESKFVGFRNAFDALPEWIARIELERYVLIIIIKLLDKNEFTILGGCYSSYFIRLFSSSAFSD